MEGWAKGITEIIWVPDLDNTPACVNRQTGVMYLSQRHMRSLPPDIRLLIMLHEMAHVVLQTTNEVVCDAWAFAKYARMGKSLKASVYALTSILNEGNPDHYMRMYLQLERAKLYDYQVNGNKKVYQNAG